MVGTIDGMDDGFFVVDDIVVICASELYCKTEIKAKVTNPKFDLRRE